MKQENLSKLRHVLEDEGFSETLKAVGEAGLNQENLIRSKNDSTLRNALGACFYLMMEAYPRAGKKIQARIKQAVFAPIFQDALETLKWSEPGHCEAMKKARAAVLELKE